LTASATSATYPYNRSHAAQREEWGMARFPVLEWDALGQAIQVKEQPTAIGAVLFDILNRMGYTVEDIATVARTLYSYVD
jgi:hypothetical protein